MNGKLLMTLSITGLCGMYGLLWLVIGLRGIITKRPFLISTRWSMSPIFSSLLTAYQYLRVSPLLILNCLLFSLGSAL